MVKLDPHRYQMQNDSNEAGYMDILEQSSFWGLLFPPYFGAELLLSPSVCVLRLLLPPGFSRNREFVLNSTSW